MATIIDENKMMDEALFKHEERVKSPLSRFIDKNFTPVNYFHINNEDTTTDAGWKDVEDILSDKFKSQYRLKITKTNAISEDEKHIGYLKLDKISV